MSLFAMNQTQELARLIRAADRTYVVGNGGSYANSFHLVNDLLFCGVKAFTIDPATLSAFANDFGWERAIERWVRIVGQPQDLLVAMSGSGTSKNILNAVSAAQSIGMSICRLFGNERGEDMQQAEESQLMIGHGLRVCLQNANSYALPMNS